MQQAIVEVYRTQEDKAKFYYASALTITYFGEIAFIQALSGTFTIKCWKEVTSYLANKGCKEMHYYRKDRLKIVKLI